MCDCFTAYCHGYACGRTVEVHCADFCMRREDYITYCKDCLPERDVVIYTTSATGGVEAVLRIEEERVPAGYTMGIRYRRKPPKAYGISAVTPNVGAPWIGKWIDKNGRVRWFTDEDDKKLFAAREAAVAHGKKARAARQKAFAKLVKEHRDAGAVR